MTDSGLAYKKLELTARPEWGVINFESIKTELNDLVFPLLEGLAACRLGLILDDQLDEILAHLTNLVATLSGIDKFSLGNGDPQQKRDALAANLKKHAGNLYKESVSHIIYWGQKSLQLDDILNEAQKTVTEVAELKEEATTLAEEQKKEIARMLEDIKQAGAEVGVDSFSNDFTDEAKSLQGRAGRWLIATLFVAGVTAAFAGLTFFGQLTPTLPDETGYLKTYLWIHSVTSKFILMGVLITAALWCGRVYKALSHQVAVNKHRAAALRTFRVFVNAADTPEIKDAVLIEATRAIFGLAHTGFLGESNQQSSSGVQILEIARSLNPIKKG